MQWWALLCHSGKVLGTNPQGLFCVEIAHAPHVYMFVSSFLPQSWDTHLGIDDLIILTWWTDVTLACFCPTAALSRVNVTKWFPWWPNLDVFLPLITGTDRHSTHAHCPPSHASPICIPSACTSGIRRATLWGQRDSFSCPKSAIQSHVWPPRRWSRPAGWKTWGDMQIGGWGRHFPSFNFSPFMDHLELCRASSLESLCLWMLMGSLCVNNK